MRRLQDKVTLITGGGRGLGASIARAYVREGAKVMITARTQSELDQTSAKIEAEGGDVLTMSMDLADGEQVWEMVGKCQKDLGGIDVLVNNAARLPRVSFEQMTMEDWDKTIAVNLRAPVLACKLVLGTMKNRGGGSIINVSSKAGVRASRLETDYCASKFAIEGFSRALALEVQPYNIAVNTITPGGETSDFRIKPTSMTQGAFDALSARQRDKWEDSMKLTIAFIYLALQTGQGVTGERICAYELSERIRRDGYGI